MSVYFLLNIHFPKCNVGMSGCRGITFMFCGFERLSQRHVAVQKTSAFFALLLPRLQNTKRHIHMKETKTSFVSVGSEAASGQRSRFRFYFPGGGKIALFLGNFITFLYIMQSL